MSGKLFAPVVLNAIYAGAMVSALALPSHAKQVPAQQASAMEIMVPLPDPNPLRSLSHTPDKPKKSLTRERLKPQTGAMRKSAWPPASAP